MKKYDIPQDTKFYSDPTNPESLVALLDVRHIKGLKSRTQYLWVHDNIIDCSSLKLTLMQQLNLVCFETIEQCFDEIAIRYSSNQLVNISIICAHLYLLEKISKLCQECTCVEFVYYFSIKDDSHDVYQFRQMQKQGKISQKCIAVPEGFSQLRRNLRQMDLLPNYMFLTADQQKSNILKATLQAMTKQYTCRSILYKQFYLLCKSNISEQQMPILEKYRSIFEDQRQNPFTCAQIFKYYSCQDFFHKIINKMLRKTVNPTQTFYVQPFVRDLFEAIRTTHKKQVCNINKRKFCCYRGTSFSQKQIKQFQQNIGNYIQCLGFLSTSYSRTTAQDFCLNTLITIDVQNVNRDEQTDYGYAFIEKYSVHGYQQQILFNLLSSFRIKKVQRSEDSNIININLQYGIYPQVLYKMKKGMYINEDEQKIKNIIGYQCETFCKNQGIVLFQNDYHKGLQQIANLSYPYFQQICTLYQKKVDKTNQQKLQYANNVWKLAKLDLSRQNFIQSSRSIQKCILFCVDQLLSQQLSDEHSCLIYESVLRLKGQLFFAIKQPEQAIQILDLCVELLKQHMHKQLKQYIVVLSIKAQCYLLLAEGEKMKQQFSLMKSMIEKYQPNNQHLWYMYRNISKMYDFIFATDKWKRKQFQTDVRAEIGSILGEQQQNRTLSLLQMFEGDNMNSYYKIMIDRLSKGQHPKLDAHRQLYFIFIMLENSQKYDQNTQKQKLSQVCEQALKRISKLYPNLRQQSLYIDSLYKLSDLLMKIDRFRQCLEVNLQILGKKQKILEQKQCQCLQLVCCILIGFGNLAQVDAYIADIDALQCKDKQNTLVRIQTMYAIKQMIEQAKKNKQIKIQKLISLKYYKNQLNASINKILQFLVMFEKDTQFIERIQQQLKQSASRKQQSREHNPQDQAINKNIEELLIKLQQMLQKLRQKDIHHLKQMIKQFVGYEEGENNKCGMACIKYYLILAQVDQSIGDLQESYHNYRRCLGAINNSINQYNANSLHAQIHEQIENQEKLYLGELSKKKLMRIQQKHKQWQKTTDLQSAHTYMQSSSQKRNNPLSQNIKDQDQNMGTGQSSFIQNDIASIIENTCTVQPELAIAQGPNNTTQQQYTVSAGNSCQCQMF